ncbi:hypothetical protein Tco_1521401 [Tanacetum coccineum]
MVVQEQAEIGKDSTNPTDPHHTPTIIQPSPQPLRKQKHRKPKRKDTQIPQSSGPTKHVADEAVYKELDDSLVRAAITASSLEAEQDSGGSPKRQETMGDTIAQTRFENVSKLSNNLLLARARVESSGDKESLGEDASKQERINAIDVDEDITLVNDQDDADMFDVNTLTGDEVIVDSVDVVKTAEETRSVVEEVTAVIEKAKLVSAAEETVNVAATTVSTASTIPVSTATTTTTTIITATITDVEITLAQALAELKSAKPKAVKVVIQEPE